jgi:hypothetical protein
MHKPGAVKARYWKGSSSDPLCTPTLKLKCGNGCVAAYDGQQALQPDTSSRFAGRSIPRLACIAAT